MLNDEIERKINKNDKNKTRVNPPNSQPGSLDRDKKNPTLKEKIERKNQFFLKKHCSTKQCYMRRISFC
jgi:hypothetical protein